MGLLLILETGRLHHLLSPLEGWPDSCAHVQMLRFFPLVWEAGRAACAAAPGRGSGATCSPRSPPPPPTPLPPPTVPSLWDLLQPLCCLCFIPEMTVICCQTPFKGKKKFSLNPSWP